MPKESHALAKANLQPHLLVVGDENSTVATCRPGDRVTAGMNCPPLPGIDGLCGKQ